MYSHVNYIRHNQHACRAAKATLGYNETRKGKEGEEIVRGLFGKTGPLTREQAEWMINYAPNSTYFWRWILSPDAKEENKDKDLDLWQLAREGVRWLEERLNREGEIQLIGAEHDDHTKIPHVHAILLIERRGREKILTSRDLEDMKQAIHQMALDQRLVREQSRQQEAAEAQQVVRHGSGLPSLTRQVSQDPEIVQKPAYGIRHPAHALPGLHGRQGTGFNRGRLGALSRMRAQPYPEEGGNISFESLTDLQFEWDTFVSRISARHAEKSNLHPSKWAQLHDVAPLLQRRRKEALLLGIGPYDRPIRVQPTPAKPKIGNVLDIGTSQCGKSTKSVAQDLGLRLDWQSCHQ